MNIEINKLREDCISGTPEMREKARSLISENFTCNTPSFLAGSHISNAIEFCINNADDTGDVQWLKFNSDEGIPIFAGDDVKEIYTIWENFCTLRNNEWKASPEGIEFQNREKLQHENNIKSARKAENEFSNVNVSKIKHVIQWTNDHVENLQSLSVGFDGLTIIKRLKIAGYKKDENTESEFIQSDRNSFGRYIIGQLISTIEWIGIPYPILAMFANDWLNWPSMRRMYIRYVPGFGFQYKYKGKIYSCLPREKLPFAVKIAKDKKARQPIVSGKTLIPKRWMKLSTYLNRARIDVKRYNDSIELK